MKLLVLLGCVLLVGCGETTTYTRTSTAPPAQTTTTATTTATTTKPPRDAKTATSGGITLRVLFVRTAPTVNFLPTDRSTPDAQPPTRKAKRSEHFVYVATRVTNHTRVGLDLSCGVPVRTVLVDSRNHTFEPIKGLSQLRGNPRCNAQLQPGSSDRMTWVFLAPRSTVLNALAFTDFTDTRKPAPFQQIPL
jgi:hypothetical protein